MPTTETNLPCPDCDSSDALSKYDDGSTYCFSCRKYRGTAASFTLSKGEALSASISDERSEASLPTGLVANVPSRGLQRPSLGHYGVEVEFNESNGEVNKLWFPVYRKGEQVGWKIKDLLSGSYTATGDCKNPDLFGANKVGEGGKLLIITEGEVDAMSAHQMLMEQGKEYNVVSLPNGANVSAVRKNLEWIESFETIILNLDGDEVGRECATDLAAILTPGKVKIMALPVKDANEFLCGKYSSRAYLKAIYNAKIYKPEGIITLTPDLWESIWDDGSEMSLPYPWHGLNRKIYGMRGGEITTWTAGTGIGKSAVIRELEHYLWKKTEDNIGILALEEQMPRTVLGMVGVELNRPLAIKEERIESDEVTANEAYERMCNHERLHLIATKKNHINNADKLLSNVRYMIMGLGCKWIILDHLSIVVSSLDREVDERRAIDIIMTRLVHLAVETGAGIHLIVHLRRMEGNKSHEQGLQIGLSHLRGSQSIAQLSDQVIALERNQQALCEKESNLTRVRVLKDRYAGMTGIATHLAYSRETGRLREIKDVEVYLAPTVEEAGV